MFASHKTSSNTMDTTALPQRLPLRHLHSTPPVPCPHCRSQRDDMQPRQAPITPFAGRLGGNQEFIVDRDDPSNAALISQIPDAAPGIPIRELFNLHGFRQPELWTAALMEGVGSLIIVYVSAWIGISPNTPPEPPDSPASVFGTAAFFGPLIGGITNAIIVPILIYCFGGVSGGHLNPFITIATFCGRLTTLPRMVLYVAFQLLGSSLAGLLVRASYGGRDYKVGGCFLFEELGTTPASAMAIEFTSCFALIFFAFGVGLDPRQREIFGPALAPALVGLALGTLSFGMSWARPGYGGPSMSPARCFGVYVGSRFPGWHWVHWTAAIAASVGHGFFYWLVPPWTSGINAEKAREKLEGRIVDGRTGEELGHGNGGLGQKSM